MKNKVILLGQSHYHGLNLARSFAAQGIRPYGIIIGQHSNRFLEASKSWCKIYQAESDEAALKLLTEKFGAEKVKPVVIPWSDSILALLDRNLDWLEDRFILSSVVGKAGEISRLMDKKEQAAWAGELGLHTGPVCILSLPLQEEELGQIEEGFRYPLFLKPVSSCEGRKEDMRRIESLQELRDYCAVLERNGFYRILVQEFMEITTEYDLMGYCSPDGFSYSVAEKLRVWPSGGGAACYGRIIDCRADREYFEDIIRKLARSGYCGPFDMDLFRVGEELFFNEINWRSSANVFAADMSGNHYPYWWYLSVTGQPDEDAGNEKEGGAGEEDRSLHKWYYTGPCRWFMNEFRDFRHVVHRELSLNEWRRDVMRTEAFAFWDKDDTGPFRANLSDMLTGRLRRGKRKDAGNTKEEMPSAGSPEQTGPVKALLPDTEGIREEARAGTEKKDREFKVIPKPDSISCDLIAEVLREAHRANEAKGMHFATAVSTGEEIAEHVGQDGGFFVVMDGEEVCAVCALKYRTWDKWFCRGELCGDIMLVGVREAYKGLGLSNLMYETLEEIAFRRCALVTMNTALNNTIMLDSRLHRGWRYVDYFSHKGTDFYSVMLAKWRDGCPYTEEYCRKMYLKRRRNITLLKKKNGEYRMWAKMIGKR
ncbi:MAG: hypothetical protein Q4F25_04440 [Eubacteriales bacterium]|nr:hypothetical protein [Eubacteriales bacterium]